VLKKIVDNGGQIIFCTARPQKQRIKLESSLKAHGIKWHDIIMGCFHSQRVIINDYAPSNPYPSAIAISLERNNDNLEYLLNDL